MLGLFGQVSLRPKSVTPVSPQQVHNKSATSWRGQKVRCVCRVVSQIPLQRLVVDLLSVSLTSPQQVGNFPVYGEVTGKRV